MSVLSRPTRHHVTAPTQRETKIPLPRTAPGSESTTAERPSQITQPAPQPRRTRTTMILGGGLAVALALGVGTFALLDDGGTSTVIAPAVVNVPDFADLGRDAAAAARAADAAAAFAATDVTAVSEAQRDAALAQRARNSVAGTERGTTPNPAPQAPATVPFSAGDAAQSEAQRDAALARRAQNIPQ